jgi:hypothetical protein
MGRMCSGCVPQRKKEKRWRWRNRGDREVEKRRLDADQIDSGIFLLFL